MAGKRVILSHVVRSQAEIDSSGKFLVVRYDYVQTGEEFARFRAGEAVDEQMFGFPMSEQGARNFGELLIRKADEMAAAKLKKAN
jgi:hypothetical protein